MPEVGQLSTLPFTDPLHDRQRRDLSYLALAAVAEAARLSALVKEVLH